MTLEDEILVAGRESSSFYSGQKVTWANHPAGGLETLVDAEVVGVTNKRVIIRVGVFANGRPDKRIVQPKFLTPRS